MDLSIEENGDVVEVNLQADEVTVNYGEGSANEQSDIECAGEGVFGKIGPENQHDIGSIDEAMLDGSKLLMRWIMDRGGCLDSEATFIKRAVEGDHYFRANKGWLEEEEMALFYLATERELNTSALSQRLGRSESAIQVQINKSDYEAGSRDWYRRHKESWGELEEEIAESLLSLDSHSNGVRWDIPKVAFLLGRSCSAVKDRKPQIRASEGHNTSWNPLSWGRLLYHKSKDRSNSQIARKLGRTDDAVASQFSILNRSLNGSNLTEKLKAIGRRYELEGERPELGSLSQLEDRVRDRF